MAQSPLVRFVKPGHQIGIAGAGLVREFDGPVAYEKKPLLRAHGESLTCDGS